MSHWQPIETARKDNKSILVWCPENKCQYMVTWNDGWFIFGGFTRLTRDVTHWRELPLSPEVEPQPQQPLRWVENTKPDKPGIWAWQYTDWNSITNVSGIICASDLIHAASKGVRYCYLGPIPEILPPKKKVVERLWVKCGQRYATDSAEYTEAWIAENDRTVMKDEWIRTDRTREVER